MPAYQIASILEQACARALNQATRETLKKAVDMSSGNISLSQLRKMDHPYARRHGWPLLPRDQINIQADEAAKEGREPFIDSWDHEDAHFTNDGLASKVTNDNPVADDSTQPNGSPRSTMFSRPIDVTLYRFAQAEIPKRVEEQIEAAFSQDIYL